MMASEWSTSKLLANLEERDKRIDGLEEQISILSEQLSDEEDRCKKCVKVLWSLLHPEELGWAVSQEVRNEVKQTLINIGEYYESKRTETQG